MTKRRAGALLLLGLAVVALGLWAARVPWPRRHIMITGDAPDPIAAKAWGLQLQNVAALAIPEAVDILVVDYSRDGSDKRAWTPAAVEALKRRESGRPRLVLCYLSIGEAESYRYYWRERWLNGASRWLGPENPSWKGNFAVRFWEPSWQRIIVEPAPTVYRRLLEFVRPQLKPYLDRILEAGFDGVYLDRIDAFAEWEKTRGKQAEADMVAFVRRISSYAKARKPDFLVVPQNGEELLKHETYLAAIDGAAKEDLLYGIGGEEVQNDPGAVAATTEMLDRVRRQKKPVLVVEYLADAGKRTRALREIMGRGYLPLIAARALNTPPLVPEAGATPSAGGAEAAPRSGR